MIGDNTSQIVLVTGSNGYIGSAVVERLSSKFRVIGLDRAGSRVPDGTDAFVEIDVQSDNSVDEALSLVSKQFGKAIASVIHLAAYYDFSGEPSTKYDVNTFRGTGRLLRGLQKFAVDQFVFSSTMLVHAPCEPGQRINEDWPLEPKWDYPRSKVDTEKLIQQEHEAIPFVLLRIAGVYDDSCHSIPIAHQIQRISERTITSQVFPGDTSRGQAFVHLDDLVEAIFLLVERRLQLPVGLTLLVGEPETLSYEELQFTLGRLIHDETWETRQIPKSLAKTGAWLQDKMPMVEDPFIKPWMIDLADDHYALDISRARSLLGWEPKHSLREALPKMISALKADPLKWYRDNKLDPPSNLEKESRAWDAASR